MIQWRLTIYIDSAEFLSRSLRLIERRVHLGTAMRTARFFRLFIGTSQLLSQICVISFQLSFGNCWAGESRLICDSSTSCCGNNFIIWHLVGSAVACGSFGAIIRFVCVRSGCFTRMISLLLIFSECAVNCLIQKWLHILYLLAGISVVSC